MASSNHNTNDIYKLYVKYEWIGSPHRDYTLKAYSKFSSAKIYDSSGNTNKINMDGQSPSGFTDSSYTGMHSNCDRYFAEPAEPAEPPRSIADTEVKSLLDIMNKADNVG